MATTLTLSWATPRLSNLIPRTSQSSIQRPGPSLGRPDDNCPHRFGQYLPGSPSGRPNQHTNDYRLRGGAPERGGRPRSLPTTNYWISSSEQLTAPRRGHGCIAVAPSRNAPNAFRPPTLPRVGLGWERRKWGGGGGGEGERLLLVVVVVGRCWLSLLVVGRCGC